HHARVLVAPVLLRGHDVSDYACENHLVTCCSESTIPTIVQSVGVSSRLNGKLASLPRHQNTSSPTPAPTESTATIGLPDGSRFLSTVCTISSFRPLSESFFTVATTVPITRASCMLILDHVNRINHANNSRVDRNIFHPLGQARARSGNHQHTLVKSGAHCVNCNHVAGGVAAVYIDRSHDQQLLSGQSFVFLRG